MCLIVFVLLASKSIDVPSQANLLELLGTCLTISEVTEMLMFFECQIWSLKIAPVSSWNSSNYFSSYSQRLRVFAKQSRQPTIWSCSRHLMPKWAPQWLFEHAASGGILLSKDLQVCRIMWNSLAPVAAVKTQSTVEIQPLHESVFAWCCPP